MSLLAPLWLGIAAAAAVGVVALHLIATRRPEPTPFPTARFVPSGEARASSRTTRPTDLLLLLLRCAAVLLLGAAFAGPVTHAGGATLARVIIADRSRASLADVRDSALALAEGGDALVVLDSVARVVAAGAPDSLRALAPSRARGSLSAALVAAERAAAGVARHADSVELVIVSPVAAEELDAASAAIFAHWPGRVRLVRTRPAPSVQPAIELSSDDPDDALHAPVAALDAERRAGAAVARVRVIRGAPAAGDSAAARAGAAVVVWPRIGGGVAAARGLWAGDATLVAPLASLPLAPGGRVVARWGDGQPAAAEWALGAGCIRVVAVGIPAAGDVTLQPAFAGVTRTLLGPCAGVNTSVAAPDSVARRFARGGAAVPASTIRSRDDQSALAPWLVGAALLLLVGESIARRAPAEART